MPYKDPKVAKQKAAERYLKNIEERKRKLKENYLAKKEERIAKAREYAISNFDKTKEYQDKYREENREKLREAKKSYYAENRDKVIQRCSDYQRNNPEKARLRQHRYEATYKGRFAKLTYRNNRRARERNARLGNVFLKETLEIYRQAYKMRKEGFKVEVDHIVPISHPSVCGLHVPWNLQIIASKENRTKGNSFDPL